MRALISGSAAILRKTRRQDSVTQDRPWDRMMLAVQEGDRETYGRLLFEVAGWLRTYYNTRVSSYVVERLVQATLTAIHEKRHTYEPSRSFETWLMAITQYQWAHARCAASDSALGRTPIGRSGVRHRRVFTLKSSPTSIQPDGPPSRVNTNRCSEKAPTESRVEQAAVS
jgi:DNA-directed RNA polymerase specialized sigma24 family protein